MTLPRKLRKFLRNPITIIVPIVVLLWLGWGHYISASRDLSRPATNLLPSGSFDSFNKDFVPNQWQIVRNGDFTYTTGKTKGYVGGLAWVLTIKDYVHGSASLIGPKVAVQPNTNYLYKGFYQTTVPFDLLVHYYYADGTSSLQYVDSYPGESGQWTTNSLAFNSGQTITAVSVAYNIAGNGNLQLDGSYLEPKTDGIYIAPQPVVQPSLISNNTITQQTGNEQPVGWSTFTAGNNQHDFTYKHENDNNYLRAMITKYHDGEAKWQYAPRAVHGNQQFRFSADYRSDRPIDVVAEYVLANGSRQFETIATVQPSGNWTNRSLSFETPATAQTMFVSFVLHGNGTVDTDNYLLNDITRAGEPQFNRPLVSVTFDDGWESSYTAGARILDDEGYRGTFYLNPSVLDTKNFFSSMQVEDLQRRGHELAAHGYNHLDMTTLDAGQLAFQLESTHRYILQKTKTTIDYASPYGKSDAEVQYWGRKYYQSIRGTDSGLNTKQNFDQYNIKVLYIGSKTTAQEIDQALQQAQQNHGWLVLIYHRVEQPNHQTEDSNVIVSPQVFEQQLKQLKRSNITVVPVADALAELQSQLNH